MTNAIHDAVRQHYAARIVTSSSCCADSCCSSESSVYPADLLSALPPDLAETSYGCGDPITLASLHQYHADLHDLVWSEPAVPRVDL